jgi:hypothetical protein
MAYEPDIIDQFYPPGSDARRLYDKFKKEHPRGWVYGKDKATAPWQKRVMAYAEESGWGDDVSLARQMRIRRIEADVTEMFPGTRSSLYST